MKLSRRHVLSISLAVTGAGALLLRFYVDRYLERATGGPERAVVVLTRDVAPGETLARAILTTRKVPLAYIESRHVLERDLPDVVGTRLAVAGRAGESLLWSDLASMRDAQRQLSALIPPGMRALHVQLRAGAFDQLLSPGDRVDVMLVEGGGQATDTVAQNVLVLAVGQDLGGQDKARGAGKVALAVTVDQGRRLAEAERRGELRLLLRHPEDTGRTQAALDPPDPRRGR